MIALLSAPSSPLVRVCVCVCVCVYAPNTQEAWGTVHTDTDTYNRRIPTLAAFNLFPSPPHPLRPSTPPTPPLPLSGEPIGEAAWYWLRDTVGAGNVEVCVCVCVCVCARLYTRVCSCVCVHMMERAHPTRA